VVGLFGALTVVMTWPQALYFSSHAPQHQDVYFNMWRLRWFAHAIASRSALFDTNIFFPEPGTLALSDAMLVEGALALPFGWLPPVLLHNLFILGAIAGSGAAMFALVRYLTGSRGAAVVAGVVFAFAPYRFDHIMHMELQWALWSPLAFLALHRAYDAGRWRDGLAAGTFVALQMLSSIYYGIFLATLLSVAGLLLFPRDRQAPARQVAAVIGGGAVLAAVICALYALPYLRAHGRVGERAPEEIAALSAKPSDYLSAPAGNWLYGSRSKRAAQERHLFPGLTPVLLAIVGLLLRVLSRRAIVYLVLLVLAFEMSLGMNGYGYSFLHQYVPIYRALRASSRLGVFLLMFLGVLAGFGYAALAAARFRPFRLALLTVCIAAMLVEYRTRTPLVEFANTAPEIYRVLSGQPRGGLAEFPVPTVDRLPGPDPAYAYMSSFHWFPLVNGYSGIYPPSYLGRLERLRSFPSETAMIQLRRDNVQYVIIHGWAYAPDTLTALRTQIDRDGWLLPLGTFTGLNGDSLLYRMR
jgi:hypothetical protein